MSVCDKWTLSRDPGQELALTEPTSPLQDERLKEVTSAKHIGPTRPVINGAYHSLFII